MKLNSTRCTLSFVVRTFVMSSVFCSIMRVLYEYCTVLSAGFCDVVGLTEVTEQGV